MESRLPLPSTPARDVYRSRLEVYQNRWRELERRDLLLGYAKIASVMVGAALLWAVFGLLALPAWSLAVVIAVFVPVAIVHDRVIQERQEAQFAIAFYEQGLRRLDDRWAGAGNRGDRFADPNHPYAVDLDLFGHGSLFELLCTASTRSGEETLAEWITQPAGAAVARARQEAAAELVPELELREQIALRSQDGMRGMDPEALGTWGHSAPAAIPPGIRAAAIVIAALTAATGILWALGFSAIPFVALALAGQVLERSQHSRTKKIIRGVDQPARDLRNLSRLLTLIESASFRSPLLVELHNRVTVEGASASERIEQLELLVDRLNARQNQVFALFAALLLWTTIWASEIEKWRLENGRNLDAWLAAVGEFEALNSLAVHAYEHPDDAFPEIVDSGVVFRGRGLRHPLLPESRAVANDVELGDSNRVWIVSGSNMSGKSTLLRTTGTNAVLALAGGKVTAKSLTISPLQIGASIRTLDSLQGGISRFYAEVLRLRQIVELADSGPLLFLLDEILHGTNSHDRLIGAEAVVKTLVKRGAVGLVTTHDLALARISDEPESGARNVHFQDHLEDGEMRFDYRLLPGVVTRSNALELMRSVGLEV